MTDKLPNPRKRAVSILNKVIGNNQLLEDVLSDSLKGLENRDRALARAMASTAPATFGYH